MRRHWQRKPLLIRQAIPDVHSPANIETLFALAARDDVESRLVSRRGNRWSLSHGPFETEDLPPRSHRAWSLLVQGVDLHVSAAHHLLRRFRFIPDSRLDDLMISFATDGGGVGPHVDSYDVFLLQVQGRRRWRIAPPALFALRQDTPLKILAKFNPTESWELDPGDMLYLPPGWAHDGTAIGECMTCSIGFRSPSRHELLRAFLADSADTLSGPDLRQRDAGRAPVRHPAELPADQLRSLGRWLADWRPTTSQIEDFLGRYLTEPKAQVWFETPRRASSLAVWWPKVGRIGVTVEAKTRIAYRGRRFFINGESLPMPNEGGQWLRRLANDRHLVAEQLRELPATHPLAVLLHAWYCAGWLREGKADRPESSR